MGFFGKIGQGLKKTRDSLMNSIGGMLRSFTRIDEELFEELEEILITADVSAVTAQHLCERLRETVRREGVTDPQQVQTLLMQEAAQMLRGGQPLQIATKPSVILVIGVNGVGKTTTIGKLAARLTQEGKKVILGAADTFRAAAVEQLQLWGKRTGAEVITGKPGCDPASVAFSSAQYALENHADILLIDTAGRQQTRKALMDELSKIVRAIGKACPGAPNEVWLTVDASLGSNALSQAREFSKSANLTGLVLTKLDGSGKGGMTVAIHREFELPTFYTGFGEAPEDLQDFDAAMYAQALFQPEEN